MHIIAAALCSKQWDKGRMIGKLKGIIDSYGEDFIVLDVNGVGYLVQCSARTLQELPGAGQPAALSIETHVREDQIRLFGFLTDVEREWFRLLQTVQGVGAKVALSVLGTLKPADLASAIAMRDKSMVARSPGVGPKVAERIVTELKDKAPAYATVDLRVSREFTVNTRARLELLLDLFNVFNRTNVKDINTVWGSIDYPNTPPPDALGFGTPRDVFNPFQAQFAARLRF